MDETEPLNSQNFNKPIWLLYWGSVKLLHFHTCGRNYLAHVLFASVASSFFGCDV